MFKAKIFFFAMPSKYLYYRNFCTRVSMIALSPNVAQFFSCHTLSYVTVVGAVVTTYVFNFEVSWFRDNLERASFRPLFSPSRKWVPGANKASSGNTVRRNLASYLTRLCSRMTPITIRQSLKQHCRCPSWLGAKMAD